MLNNCFFNSNIFLWAKKIGRPLILDGASGSFLQNKGFQSHPDLWMSYISVEHPDVLLNLHKTYCKAGADIITTNTFRSNPNATKNQTGKYSSENLVKNSLGIAREAAATYTVFVAGSNPPAEDCYQKERKISKKNLIYNHHKHIDLLMNYGSDFILNETQSHFDEIKIICNYCFKRNVPYLISLFFTDDLRILSGESIYEVINFAKDFNPLAISFNCIPPDSFKKLDFGTLSKHSWGVYLNCIGDQNPKGKLHCGINPEDYSELLAKYLKNKPSFFGGCCGTTPAHIKKIKELIDEKIRNKNTC